MKTSIGIALALCAGISGIASAQQGNAPPSTVSDALRSLPATDQAFLRQASGALLTQTRLGQLAAQNASSPQVRQIGQMIADQGTQTMQRLQQNASDMNLTLPAPQMTARQMTAYNRLAQIKGPAFDEAYMEEVQALQQQTQVSFANESLNGESPAVQRFAQQTLPLLRKNADQIQRQFAVIKQAPPQGKATPAPEQAPMPAR